MERHDNGTGRGIAQKETPLKFRDPVPIKLRVALLRYASSIFGLDELYPRFPLLSTFIILIHLLDQLVVVLCKHTLR